MSITTTSRTHHTILTILKKQQSSRPYNTQPSYALRTIPPSFIAIITVVRIVVHRDRTRPIPSREQKVARAREIYTTERTD